MYCHTVTCWVFYRLLHVEMLLLGGISREEGELVELNAVLEGQPRLHAKTFVRLTIHANPRVLGVHLVYNLDPLHPCLANNKTTELIHLQGLRYHKFAGVLEVFLDRRERFPMLILLGLCFTFWGLEEWFQLLPHFNYNLKGLPNFLNGPLLL